MKKILSIAVLSTVGALVFTAHAGANGRSADIIKIGTYEAGCKIHGSDVFGCIDADFAGCGIINPIWCLPGTQIPDSEKPDGNIQIKPEKPEEPDTDSDNDSNNNSENNGNNQNGGNNQGGGSGSNNGNGTGSEASTYITEILRLVNSERAKYGLSPLSASDSTLNSAAQKRAEEQSVMFSHTRPSGKSWTTVLADFGISYRKAGENVAYGQRSASEVMNAWMNSEGHRANILGEGYKELGVGHYKKNGTDYWAQIFIG